MNPILDLRRLLIPVLPNSGMVIGVVRAGMYRVRTAAGVQEVSGLGSYNDGDEVVLNNGVIQGKLKPLSSVPEYRV